MAVVGEAGDFAGAEAVEEDAAEGVDLVEVGGEVEEEVEDEVLRSSGTTHTQGDPVRAATKVNTVPTVAWPKMEELRSGGHVHVDFKTE